MESRDSEKSVVPENERAAPLPRKAYVPPQLTIHGTVSEITKALAPAGDDGVTGLSL